MPPLSFEKDEKKYSIITSTIPPNMFWGITCIKHLRELAQAHQYAEAPDEELAHYVFLYIYMNITRKIHPQNILPTTITRELKTLCSQNRSEPYFVHAKFIEERIGIFIDFLSIFSNESPAPYFTLNMLTVFFEETQVVPNFNRIVTQR